MWKQPLSFWGIRMITSWSSSGLHCPSQPSWSPPSPTPPSHRLGPLNSLVFVAWKPLLPPSGLLKLLFLEFALGLLLIFYKPFFSSQKSDFYENASLFTLLPLQERSTESHLPQESKTIWSGLTNFPFGLLPLFSLTNLFTVCLQRSTILLAFSNLIAHGWANYIVHLHGYIKSFFFFNYFFILIFYLFNYLVKKIAVFLVFGYMESSLQSVGFSSYGMKAQLPPSMWDLTSSTRNRTVCPVLEGIVLTTGPPGKPPQGASCVRKRQSISCASPLLSLHHHTHRALHLQHSRSPKIWRPGSGTPPSCPTI